MSSFDEADAQQDRHSVYDFLYFDTRRVGAFLAQFGLPGVPQSVKQTAGQDTAQQSDNTRRRQVGLPQGVLGLTLDQKLQSTTTLREGTEQVFDPVWLNAIALLTHLQQQQLLVREVSAARIGQFALASGSLGVADMGLLRTLWTIPAIRGLIEQSIKGSPTVASGRAAKVARQEANTQSKSVIELLKGLPHTIQASIVAPGNLVTFGILQEDGLVGSSSDLLLKNGAIVPGRWNMLGVVDALPDNEEVALDEVLAGMHLSQTPFGAILMGMSPMLRAMGRPAAAYGMTPLLIFREVEPA